MKNILKYLRRTKDVFLVYGGEEDLVVTGYTDASFQTDKDDSKSQSGFMFKVNGGAVSWKSSEKETVADSVGFLFCGAIEGWFSSWEHGRRSCWVLGFLTTQSMSIHEG